MIDRAETNSLSSDAKDDRVIDIEGIVADFRRYFGLFAKVFFIAFLLVIGVFLMQTPKFTATTSVIVGDENKQALPGKVDNQPADALAVESEMELLKSSTIAERVMKDLKLDQDPEFNPELGRRTLGGSVRKFFTLHALKTDVGQSGAVNTLRDQGIINAIESGLDVNRIDLTRVITVSYRSVSREKAAAIANAWARQYLLQKAEAGETSNKQTTDFLSGRIDALRSQVETSERQVQQYKIANNLLSADGATLTEQEISDLNRQLASARVVEAESQARLSTARGQIAAGSQGDDVGEALSSPVVSSLRAQAAETSSQLANLQSRYGPQHPEVLKAQQQLADIDKQIQAEIRRVLSNLDAQNQIQRQRAGSLVGSVARAQGQLAANSKAMVKLKELELNAESVRALYESYLDRLKQSVTGAGAGEGDLNVRVVTQARVPTGQSSPKPMLGLLLATATAFLAASGSVLARRAFDSGLTTGNQVEEKLGLHYLAGVPDLASTLGAGVKSLPEPHRYISQKPLSAFAEGFRSLHVSLVHANPEKKVQVIAVTSALPSEGKTTTSVCLATTIALAGESVVVVDCDMRRRSLNSLFGLTVSKGLLELLSGNATLDEVLVSDQVSGLSILPLSDNPPNGRDVFSSDAMDAVLEQLRARFDRVILDTAPVLPVVDTRILARKADAVALLVRWSDTPVKAAQRAAELIQDAGANLVGAALTLVDVNKQAKYGYGDSGYYYKSYKGYYTEG